MDEKEERPFPNVNFQLFGMIRLQFALKKLSMIRSNMKLKRDEKMARKQEDDISQDQDLYHLVPFRFY